MADSEKLNETAEQLESDKATFEHDIEDSISDAEVDGVETVDNIVEDDILSQREKKLEAENAELRDKYLRLYAEFDNFRNRSENEKSQMFEMGAKSVIEKLLPVVDNFERALGTVEEEDENDAFTKGVQGIYKQIEKLFSDLDVKAIEALGEKFDPNLHNAVMTDEEADAEEDTVTADLLKGYTYRGNVIRYSMVKVKK